MRFLLVILCVLFSAVQPTKGYAQVALEERTARVMEVVDVVLESHVKPVSRQQLLLNGLLAVYLFAGESPGDLALEISALCEVEALEEFCNNKLTEIAAQTRSVSLEKLYEGFEAGVLRGVPGGATIIRSKEAAVDDSLAANRYVGVGIVLGMRDDTPFVSQVLAGGSGEKAGMLDQDAILSVDGEPTPGKGLPEIVDMLRGEEGTVVELELRQPKEESREIEVVRSVTFIPTVLGFKEVKRGEWDYTLGEKNADIAYVKFARIGPSTVHELKKVAAELRDQDLRGMILDLRAGGGLLHDAVMVADLFLESGKIGTAVMRDRREELEATEGSLFVGIPMALLIDENSGADRILIAQALKRGRSARMLSSVPNRVWYIRSRVPLSSGDQLQLPTGYWQAPDTRITELEESAHRGSPQQRMGFLPGMVDRRPIDAAVQALRAGQYTRSGQQQ